MKNVEDKYILDTKYTILLKDGIPNKCLRYGEEWRDLAGDKLILTMYQKLRGYEETLKSLLENKETSKNTLQKLSEVFKIEEPFKEAIMYDSDTNEKNFVFAQSYYTQLEAMSVLEDLTLIDCSDLLVREGYVEYNNDEWELKDKQSVRSIAVWIFKIKD